MYQQNMDQIKTSSERQQLYFGNKTHKRTMQAAHHHLLATQDAILWRFKPARLESESDLWEWETFANSVRNGRMNALHDDLLKQSQPTVDCTLQLYVIKGGTLEVNRRAWLEWKKRLTNARFRYERLRRCQEQREKRTKVDLMEAQLATEELWRRIVRQKIMKSPKDHCSHVILPRPLPGSAGNLIHQIITHRVATTGYQYYVWWLGYSPMDASWVDADAFINGGQNDLLDAYHRAL